MQRRYWSAICLVMLLYFVNWYLCFEGYDWYDDTSYLRHAYRTMTTSWEELLSYPHEQAQRWGFLLPLAFCLHYLPFNELSHTVYSLVVALFGLSLPFMYLYNRQQPLLASWVALLLGTDYYFWYLSNKIYPDISTAVAVFWGLLVLQNIEERGSSFGKALMFCGALFWAFLSKLTVAFVSLFLLERCLTALWGASKELRIFWLQTMLIAMVLLGGYLAVYAWVTHDAFFRFTQIEAHRYADTLSYFDKDYWVLLQRLTYMPFLMFVRVGYIANLILFLPLWVYWKELTPPEKFWGKALLYSLVFYWFGSTSWAVYSPIPLDYRMAVVLSPLLAVGGGFALLRAEKNIYYYAWYACGFGLTAWVAHAVLHTPKAYWYGLLAMFFVFYFIVRSRYAAVQAYLLVLVVIGTLPMFYTMYRVDAKAYLAEKTLLQQVIYPQKDSVQVYTDSRLAAQYDLYYQFHAPLRHQFRSFDTLKTPPIMPRKQVYVLVNGQTIRYLESYTGRKFPSWLLTLSSYYRLVARQGDVSLWVSIVDNDNKPNQ